MLLREPQLQFLVLPREIRVAPEGVTEGEALAPQITSRLRQMQAVRDFIKPSGGLREMMRDARSMRCVDVGQRSECLEGFARFV